MWEDNRNKRGGRWLLSLAKQQRHIELDRLWLETVSGGGGGKGAGVGRQEGGGLKAGGVDPASRLEHLPFPFWVQLLCLLGESFEEHSKEVCGAVVNIRAKGDKIAVWTSEAENQAGVMHIGCVPSAWVLGAGWVVAWPARETSGTLRAGSPLILTHLDQRSWNGDSNHFN